MEQNIPEGFTVFILPYAWVPLGVSLVMSAYARHIRKYNADWLGP